MRKTVLALVSLVLLASFVLAVRSQRSRALDPDSERASIVFVCRNGVAMSVWSALTFNQLALERGLPVRATSRAAAATLTEVPLRMRVALALDGYRVGGYAPRVVDVEDVRRAERVILIDADLPQSVSVDGAAAERWDGFPPMREQYFISRAALRTRVEELVDRLAPELE